MKLRIPVRLVMVCFAGAIVLATGFFANGVSGADEATASDTPLLLTPKPGPEPQINGPRLFGVRPGRPFIYRIPCTGARPMSFTVKGLPTGMSVDSKTGVITGDAPEEAGGHLVTLGAKNDAGADEKEFTIAVGDKLALTPPMGWNSWYIHRSGVTEENMRRATDAMVESGMADFGYMYVNIDDGWMKRQGDTPYRDNDGAMLPNSKFPDIKGMVDRIHSRGLRAGLYTSPGPWTCAGYLGTYKHEEKDAAKYAEWGFDFLKYDWCSYGRLITKEKKLEEYTKPYKLMGGILKKQNRDIVHNLCQYGQKEVWQWGGEVGGHCWRTTGDIEFATGKRLPYFYHIGFMNAKHWEYAKPGEWNDPDYILIGVIWSRQTKKHEPVGLTPHEQFSYMSMWCLMAAPLVYSGDMAQLDEQTLNVLCNAEVIAINQDALGKQARVVRDKDQQYVMAKPLEDGSMAVGLFNLGESKQEIAVSWGELGLEGEQAVRDLWRQKDISSADGQYKAEVEPHGVMLVRIQPKKES